MADGVSLDYVKAQFVDAEDAAPTLAHREHGAKARRYRDGEQWTDAEIAKLEARGQPVITDNKIADKVEYLLGVERNGRTDPKAYPRNVPSDEQSADAATDALRYIADANMFNYVRSSAAEVMFVEGVCGIEIVVDKTKKLAGSPKIAIRDIRWDRLYWDPHSMKADFSDAKYKGVVTWMDYEEAVAKFGTNKDAKAALEASIDRAATANNSEETDDKPRWVTNTSDRRRVQILDHYFLQPDGWWHCVFVDGGFLEKPAKSAYLDYESSEEGVPACPIEIQALHRRGEDGEPYGRVKRDLDLQDDWNKRRSKSLHLLNVNQIEAEEGAFPDRDGTPGIEVARREASRPDGVILRTPGMEATVSRNLDLALGHLRMMELTGQSLAASGPNAALLGASGATSGRAKMVDQQGGMIAIDTPFDTLKYLVLRVYRQVWNRVRQFWTQETWLRVRDEEHLRFVALNRVRTRGEVIAETLAKRQMPDEEKQQILARIASDPYYREQIKQNDVALLDVDIILDDAPDVVSLQQEQFTMLVQLAESRPEVPFKTLVELSSLSAENKRKVLAQDEAPDPMQAQMQAMQAKMAELELILSEAKVRREVAATAKDEAAANESRIDAAVKVAEFTGADAGQPKTSVSVN